MSVYADATYDVYNEQLRRAAKPHMCNACRETIEKGHRYYNITWVFDHTANGVKRCLKCQTIHEHLRHLGDYELWPSETLSCGEEYQEHWGVAPPEEIARLAFVTPAQMQEEFSEQKALE